MEEQERELGGILFRRRKRGRHKKPKETRKFYLIGSAIEQAKPVFQDLITTRRALSRKTRRKPWLIEKELLSAGFSQQEIDAGLNSKTALTAARYFVSATENLPFDVVAEYHRKYLKS